MPDKKFLKSENLNLIVAACAILISAASFYATFLQADAAEKQVKAMTLPLVQFSHGNFDADMNIDAISFSLNNAGIGPAIIKSIRFNYRDTESNSFYDFIKHCCAVEYRKYTDEYNKLPDRSSIVANGGIITSPTSNIIIPGQTDYEFLKLNSHKSNKIFWNKLNKERWQLNLDICYCSMLDDCFVSKGDSIFEEVESCES